MLEPFSDSLALNSGNSQNRQNDRSGSSPAIPSAVSTLPGRTSSLYSSVPSLPPTEQVLPFRFMGLAEHTDIPSNHPPPLPSVLAAAAFACVHGGVVAASFESPPRFWHPSTAAAAIGLPPPPLLPPVQQTADQPQHYPGGGAPDLVQPPVAAAAAGAATTDTYRRGLEALEAKQTRLAISLILASRSAVHRMDHFMRLSLLPVFLLPSPLPPAASPPALQERIHLACAAFHLALNVARRTATRVHWRRREMLAWVVSTALLLGPSALLYLLNRWPLYMSPREAVNWLAPTLFACMALPGGEGAQLPHRSQQQQQLNTFQQQRHHLASSNPAATTASTQSIARRHTSLLRPRYHHHHRGSLMVRTASETALGAGYPAHGGAARSQYQLHPYVGLRDVAVAGASLAVGGNAGGSSRDPSTAPRIHSFLPYTPPYREQVVAAVRQMAMQESHPVAHDVLWACLLAHRIGPATLQEMLSYVVRNVHCPTLLADILHRCRIPPQSPHFQSALQRPRFSATAAAAAAAAVAANRKPPPLFLTHRAVSPTSHGSRTDVTSACLRGTKAGVFHNPNVCCRRVYTLSFVYRLALVHYHLKGVDYA
ncbi:unnamed protein product [Schistocephalus solidus]|uniref:ZSWIM4-8 C-terminal domain-containing protein n=1 Tax=Schistocephalus solidus TaxID=70667 RepID=A0A183THD0_SCHSO|nr:unnamed protein product [Schistocephalus solidus]